MEIIIGKFLDISIKSITIQIPIEQYKIIELFKVQTLRYFINIIIIFKASHYHIEDNTLS